MPPRVSVFGNRVAPVSFEAMLSFLRLSSQSSAMEGISVRWAIKRLLSFSVAKEGDS